MVYTFLLTYPLFLWAELWLVKQIFGDRLESLPLPVRVILLVVLFTLPALGSGALMIPAPLPLEPY